MFKLAQLAPWLVAIVPLALWALFSLITREWQRKRVFGLIAGADNRLSLSRLQAFAWTMVIVGAYTAAMADRPPSTDLAQKKVDQIAYERAVVHERAVRATVPKAPAEQEQQQTAIAGATEAVRVAKENLVKYNWVRIPAELLILAGISLATGVFASMLASGGDGPPVAHRITVFAAAAVDPLGRNPRSSPARGKYWMLIDGSRLGGDGEVRLNGRAARPLFWEADGTAIAVDVDENRRYDTMIIDTRNGKVTYALQYENNSSLLTALTLGDPRYSYELADLVRDDTNPRNLSITKFQMFGWTLIAIVIYVYLFLQALHGAVGLDELPVVDATVVMLTGVSQLGYLGGKVASNSNAPPS